MSFLDSLIYGIRSIKWGSKELPTRNTLSFSGSGVTLVDNPSKDQIEVLIEGGGGGGASDARDVSYDDTVSEIDATNVQDAIDNVTALGRALGRALSEIEIPSNILTTTVIDLAAIPSPHDILVYTVPACLLTRIHEISVAIVEPLVGSGTVTVRSGASVGGNGYLIDTIIDNTKTQTVAGLSIATLGARFPSHTGYVAELNQGEEIHLRFTKTGTVTGGKVKIYVCGEVRQ